MLNKTSFVSKIDFHSVKTDISFTKDAINVFGRINYGPYLPIQSGSYDINVISTSDFKSFDVIEKFRNF